MQLVKGTWPYMLRIRVGAIIGEPFSSFFSLTHKASVLSHQDVFSVLRLVPGSVKRLVGKFGKSGLGKSWSGEKRTPVSSMT